MLLSENERVAVANKSFCRRLQQCARLTVGPVKKTHLGRPESAALKIV